MVTNYQQYLNLIYSHPILLAILTVWALVWKGIALWKAARNNQNVWFIVMLLLNTVGILEIVYIFFFSNKKTKEIVK